MAVVNTTSPAYQNKLQGLVDLYDQFKSLYGPVVRRMTRQQLKQLHNRDPLFAKFVEISRDFSDLAERAEVGL